MDARRNVGPQPIGLFPAFRNFLPFGYFLVSLFLRDEHPFCGVDPLLASLSHPEGRGPVFQQSLLDPPARGSNHALRG